MQTFKLKVDFPVYCAGFSPAGDILIGGGGGSVKSGIKNKFELYKLNITEKTPFEKITELELNKNEDAPSCLTFHPEENVIACGINSSKEKIELGENKNCRTFEYSNNKIKSIKEIQTITSKNEYDFQRVTNFSSNGKFIAIGGTDSKLTVLKYPSLEVAFPPLNFNKQEIYDADFNPACDQVVAISTKILRILSIKNGECIHSLESPIFQKVIQWKSDGFLFTVVNLTSKTKSFIVKWNAITLERILTKVVSKKPITSFAISDDGNLLALGCSDQSLKICDANTLRILLTVPNVHEFPATSVNFNHDSTLVVSGSVDYSVNLIKLPEKFNNGKFSLFLIILTTLILIFAYVYKLYLDEQN
ncbi:5551_t:CDS:10 [Diversispora eburnea]|uniref:5551_t:CDS:1 n=1 Tax=Diversispora eburnea TaxID=1213867 RepID=A0A9N8V5D0_9GLOM|nr:5551_t:CDS:10 [Diversispora eburnea]